jgi:hypothetical protein
MKRTILYCVSSSIILFIVSFYFRDKLFDLFFSFFNERNLGFAVHALNSTFLISLKTSASIGVIPLLLLVVWIAGKITSSRKKLFSFLIVIVCIILTIIVNVLRINYVTAMANLPNQAIFPVEDLFFEYAISIGAILGTAISYFIFRTRQRKEELNAAIKEIGQHV